MKIRKNTQGHLQQNPGETFAQSQAEAIALAGLIFLAQDPERVGRFLALTGLDPGDIRDLARERGFLLAVLDHLASDERLLLGFAAAEQLPPERVASARYALGGGDAA